MKTKRNLSFTILLIILSYSAKSQVGFMNPVGFKLKNGMHVIVAENKNTQKVYASLTVDEISTAPNYALLELLNMTLNKMAIESQAGITFNEKGGNISTSIAGLEYALSALQKTVYYASFSEESFRNLKIELVNKIKDRTKYFPEDVTEATINKLNLADLKNLYLVSFQPSKSYLTIAGNVNPAEAKLLLKNIFREWAFSEKNTETSK
ncbi:peptidase M16 family protein [Pedobacter sp. PWIIR3]